MIGSLRKEVWSRGRLLSRVRDGKAAAGIKFADYFDYGEKLTKLPSHRILVLFRGEKEEVLDLQLRKTRRRHQLRSRGSFERQIARRFGIADRGRPGDPWLIDTVRWAWRTKILTHIQLDLTCGSGRSPRRRRSRRSPATCGSCCSRQPSGARPTMGLDPGFRTGVKAAIVGATGKLAATAPIYPHQPQRRLEEAIAILASWRASTRSSWSPSVMGPPRVKPTGWRRT